MREQHPSVELRIAGVTAGQLGEVPQGVSPLGFVSPFEMDELYAGARVFIHAGKTAPDGDSDGLPNVLLEALTAGVPVASTDAGAVRDIVEHRLTGLLVPERDPVALASAVTELLENEGLRAKLAANGRDRVLERHDPGKCAKELAEVLCPSDL
ncbi:MAG: glycosyltransferase family 4 protein [Planctomycetota bacterium]|nr:glycosyltransferase family 4 protein [Planctomycetota bacterium]